MHGFAIISQQTSAFNVKTVLASSVPSKREEFFRKATYKESLAPLPSLSLLDSSTSLMYLYAVYSAFITQLHLGSHIETPFI